MNYQEFLEAKVLNVPPAGFTVDPDALNPMLFPFQRDLTAWALRRGRACLFEDCGLGKTAQQLTWGQHVLEHTNKPVLILAPLAVSHQTKREGEKFGVEVNICRSQADIKKTINITNFEMLAHFDPSATDAIIADEAGIMKNYSGKIRNQIIDAFARTPYKLSCTATPAPNDHMELGNHAEHMGVMTRTEMLAMFFVHDGGETSKWRLKGHAEDKFWQWVASWAAILRKPSDLGYADTGFQLPPINYHHHVVEGAIPEGLLFAAEALSLMERRKSRKSSTNQRVAKVCELIEGTQEPWLVWCDLNYESEMLAKEILGAVEVTGSMPPEEKEEKLLAFTTGEIQILVSKPSIAGWGMNWQHCANMAFCGLSDSFEQFYQATRRCWRFGQRRPVNVHIVTSESDGAVIANIQRKEAEAETMYAGMVEHTRRYVMEHLHESTMRDSSVYHATKPMQLPSWL